MGDTENAEGLKAIALGHPDLGVRRAAGQELMEVLGARDWSWAADALRRIAGDETMPKRMRIAAGMKLVEISSSGPVPDLDLTRLAQDDRLPAPIRKKAGIIAVEKIAEADWKQPNLVDLAADKKAPGAVKVSAIRTIASLGTALIEAIVNDRERTEPEPRLLKLLLLNLPEEMRAHAGMKLVELHVGRLGKCLKERKRAEENHWVGIGYSVTNEMRESEISRRIGGLLEISANASVPLAVREAAGTGIARISDGWEDRETLLKMAEDENLPQTVREAAGMGLIPALMPDARDVIRHVVSNEKLPMGVRVAAAQARIGRMVAIGDSNMHDLLRLSAESLPRPIRQAARQKMQEIALAAAEGRDLEGLKRKHKEEVTKGPLARPPPAGGSGKTEKVRN